MLCAWIEGQREVGDKFLLSLFRNCRVAVSRTWQSSVCLSTSEECRLQQLHWQVAFQTWLVITMVMDWMVYCKWNCW